MKSSFPDIKFKLPVFLFILFISAVKCEAQENQENKKDNSEYYHLIPKDSLTLRDSVFLSKFIDNLDINRYYPEIIQFQKEDSIYYGRETDIVFTGSSSIRRWHNLYIDFSGFKVLNRGFGGSTFPEVIHFAEILIFKHNPKTIVLYAGENDIANLHFSASKVVEMFIYVHKMVSHKLPEAHLYYISIKPSPGRKDFWPEMKLANDRIKNICTNTDNCSFVDISSAMLDKNQQIREELFISDKVHLNEKGYEIWKRMILEELKKQNK